MTDCILKALDVFAVVNLIALVLFVFADIFRGWRR